ncbi:hypothetical protein [Pleurochrysis sp. endemic virus 2]|nr:hypothetical protein [Pleurochrysis sp. endemic virus 2]
MVTSEDVGSLLLLLAAMAYTQLQRRVSAEKIMSPSAQAEINPTRWSHDGEQDASRQNGNQERIFDEHVSSIIPYLN